MVQLARKGRLKPETVAEMVSAGKLSGRTIAQLRADQVYPEKYLRRYAGAKQSIFKVPARVVKGKTVCRTIRLFRYTF